ncbi:MAG: 2-polyprenyl-3-methyl-6-methoxy-1,4-benzoquinone monooxygenase [Burkholderiales bacterium]
MKLIDSLICELDAGLRNVFAKPLASRPLPVGSVAPETAPMAAADSTESMRLMRVNHVGEVCAQALYQGQLAVARNPQTRAILEHAAREERDHLAWCASRVAELGGKTSVLSPLFYAGAWTMGVVSGLAGDKWSMGFLVETERQVEAHLDQHLATLPVTDYRTRAIVERMRLDEIEHGNSGEAAGATPLPLPIKAAMRASSRIMTATTYWV